MRMKMATFMGKLLLFLSVYVSQVKAQSDQFGIKEPFPANIYPIEGTETKVTCVAFDPSGNKTPERIQFMRKDNFARYTNVTASENVIFTQRTEPAEPPASEKLIVTMTIKNVTLNDDSTFGPLGRYECHAFAKGDPIERRHGFSVNVISSNQKLSVTMIIKNVSLNDDSTFGPLGRYECHAFAVGDPVEKKHGFSVNVIGKDEIPSVAVSKFGLLRHGRQNITIICSVTKGSQASRTTVKRISWFKNGMLVESVRNPDPDNPQDRLRPLIIRDIGTRDDGVYTCLLEVLLRNIKAHNVSDSSVITRRDNFGTVEPFPENIYPVEGTSAQVTCVAFDSSGMKIPERIQFVRKDTLARYTNVTETENIQLEEMRSPIDQGNQKLSVTMIIKNVSLNDDSTFGPLGRYECHAFAVGDPVERIDGFSVNVIGKDEIPSVAVSKFGLLQPGQDITIICNMTESRESSSTVLKRISWFKNGMLVESVRNPDPDNPLNRLRPLVIRDIGDKDDGVYTCLLEVLLRNIKAHSVLDSSVIKVIKSGSENGSICKGCLLAPIILSAIMNFLTKKP